MLMIESDAMKPAGISAVPHPRWPFTLNSFGLPYGWAPRPKSSPASTPTSSLARHNTTHPYHSSWRSHAQRTMWPSRPRPAFDQSNYSTKHINLATQPDLIIISPTMRTLQTAMNIIPSLAEQAPFDIPVQIWALSSRCSTAGRSPWS